MPAPPNLVAHKPHFHRNEAWKQPVRCATTAAGTLATSFANGQSAGGVTLATGDRILIKDQAAGTENGIYRVNATGAPTRDFDMDVAAEFVGAVAYVVAGTYAGTVWCCTNTTEPTIGVTAITWAALDAGAPTTADYLVGTAQAGLSAEIVVGTTPGGELGGTWASPTVDATHSGSAHPLVGTINFIIDGGGSAIATGIHGDLVIDFACTVLSWKIVADQTGSIVVDVWSDTYNNFPPLDADAMPGAGYEPTITSGVKAYGVTTSWTKTAIGSTDVLRFYVDSCTTITRVTIALKVTRT